MMFLIGFLVIFTFACVTLIWLALTQQPKRRGIVIACLVGMVWSYMIASCALDSDGFTLALLTAGSNP